MKDFQITIIVLGNPLFALMFYSIGRQWMNKKYAIHLPFFPRTWIYYQENNEIENYHRQSLIWMISILLAVFCSMMLAGIAGGQIYLPKN